MTDDRRWTGRSGSGIEGANPEVPLIDVAGGPGFDPDGESVTEVTGRATIGTGYGALAAVAAAVVGIVVALWALGQGAPASTDDNASPFPSATPVPGPPEPTEVTRRIPSTTTPTSMQPDRLLVGEPTGFQLLYGGDAPLQSVDLDTARATTFGLRVRPLLATGTSVVFQQTRSGQVGWLDASALGQQVDSWRSGAVAAGRHPGDLWVLDPTTEEPHPAGVDTGYGRWELYATEIDQSLEVIPGDLYVDVELLLDGGPTPGRDGRARPDRVVRHAPQLSTRPDGVYRYGDDGYRRLASGRVFAHDFATALVGTCEAEGPCDLAWIDAATGAPFDRPLPEVRPRTASVVGNSRWLLAVGWDDRAELVDLATGYRIERNWASARLTVSPDGRWLAEWLGDSVIISDIGRDGPPRFRAAFRGFEREGDGALLFVPRPE